jgi:cullin-4
MCTICLVVRACRDGYAVDRDVIQRVLRMFMSLGVYANRFEGPFLWDSWRYFQADVQKHLPGSSSSSATPSDSVPGPVSPEVSNSSSSSYSGAPAGAALAMYLQYVDRRLQQAVEMASTYLAPASRQPLLSCIEQCAITPHVSSLLQLGFSQLLDSSIDRLPDIRRAFVLLERVQQSGKLKDAWALYMKYVASKYTIDSTSLVVCK